MPQVSDADYKLLEAYKKMQAEDQLDMDDIRPDQTPEQRREIYRKLALVAAGL